MKATADLSCTHSRRPRVLNQRSPKPRSVVCLDISAYALAGLMREQKKISTGFAMRYVGTKEQFLAAGLPRELLKPRKNDKAFIVDRKDYSQHSGLSALLRSKGELLELEIHWGATGPGIGCAHPALLLIGARMLRALGYWTGNHPLDSPHLGELPIDRLAHDVGSSQPQRISIDNAKLSRKFCSELLSVGLEMHRAICCGEVLSAEQCQTEPVYPKNVVPIGSAGRRSNVATEGRPL